MGLKFWLAAVLLLVAAVECQGKIFKQRLQAVTFYRPTLLLHECPVVWQGVLMRGVV